MSSRTCCSTNASAPSIQARSTAYPATISTPQSAITKNPATINRLVSLPSGSFLTNPDGVPLHPQQLQYHRHLPTGRLPPFRVAQ